MILSAKSVIAVAFIFVIFTDDARGAWSSWSYQTPHRQRRHHPRHHQSSPYDPTFCRDIIIAFDQLPVRDLDKFVKSVPEDKRQQAFRCLTRGGR